MSTEANVKISRYILAALSRTPNQSFTRTSHW